MESSQNFVAFSEYMNFKIKYLSTEYKYNTGNCDVRMHSNPYEDYLFFSFLHFLYCKICMYCKCNQSVLQMWLSEVDYKCTSHKKLIPTMSSFLTATFM